MENYEGKLYLLMTNVIEGSKNRLLPSKKANVTTSEVIEWRSIVDVMDEEVKELEKRWSDVSANNLSKSDRVRELVDEITHNDWLVGDARKERDAARLSTSNATREITILQGTVERHEDKIAGLEEEIERNRGTLVDTHQIKVSLASENEGLKRGNTTLREALDTDAKLGDDQNSKIRGLIGEITHQKFLLRMARDSHMEESLKAQEAMRSKVGWASTLQDKITQLEAHFDNQVKENAELHSENGEMKQQARWCNMCTKADLKTMLERQNRSLTSENDELRKEIVELTPVTPQPDEPVVTSLKDIIPDDYMPNSVIISRDKDGRYDVWDHSTNIEYNSREVWWSKTYTPQGEMLGWLCSVVSDRWGIPVQVERGSKKTVCIETPSPQPEMIRSLRQCVPDDYTGTTVQVTKDRGGLYCVWSSEADLAYNRSLGIWACNTYQIPCNYLLCTVQSDRWCIPIHLKKPTVGMLVNIEDYS